MQIEKMIRHNETRGVANGQSYSEIGEKVGVSRVCVKNRMTALEQKGVIKGYKTIIDSDAAVDEGTGFILDAEVWHDHFDAALAALSTEKSVRKVYITTGDDHVHAVGITTNHANLRAMVNRLYNATFFKKICCQTILSTIKDGRISGAGIRRWSETSIKQSQIKVLYIRFFWENHFWKWI